MPELGYKLFIYTSSNSESISYQYKFLKENGDYELFGEGVCTDQEYLINKYKATDPDLDVEIIKVDDILEAIELED